MFKRWRTRFPVLYCIVAEVLFFVIMMAGGYAILFKMAFSGVDLTTVDDDLLVILQELIGAAVGLLFLAGSGRLRLVTRKGCGFLDGLLVGMYPVVMISYSLTINLLLDRPENTPLRAPWQIIAFLISMMLVGVAEEFMFRGVIAETLLEKFGTSRVGIWKACLLSGVLFGAAHLTNLLGSEPLGVLMQCAFAAALGVLLAAIYFRTGNLWVVVFIHGYMDIAGMIIGGLYGTTTVAETVSSYDLSMLYTVAIYLAPVFFLLRRARADQVDIYFGDECLPPAKPKPAER